MAIKIGTILIELQANTASFAGAMSKASQLSLDTSKQITRSLNLIGVGAAAMATTVALAFEQITQKSQDYVFQIQRAAAVTGTSTEMFSKLAYNAKLAGVPMETLKGSMERLSRATGQALAGNKGAIDAFAAVGVSVKDLQGPLKNTGDLYVQVAKNLDRYSESNQKNVLEQKLFARAGQEIAPLLAQVATGFDTASQQATLFGIVVGDKTAAESRKLHTSLVQLKSIALGLGIRLLSGVSPALNEVAQRILHVVTSSDGMNKISSIASSVATAIRAAGSAFEFLVNHATAIKLVFEGLIAMRVASIFLPLTAGATSSAGFVEKLGFSIGSMIARFSGSANIFKFAFVPLIEGAKAAYASLASMLSIETVIATNTSTFTTIMLGLRGAMVALISPTALIAASIATIGIVLLDTKSKAEQASHGAATWADVWAAAIDQITNKLLILKLAFDHLYSTEDEEDQQTKQSIKQYGLLGKTLDQVAADRANARRGITMYPGAESVADHKKNEAKVDAPTLLGKEKPEKIDHLKLKMTELMESANAARDSLAAVGQGVDAERSSAIDKEYTETIVKLNAELGKTHQSVSALDAVKIKEQITTRINDKAQQEFLDTIRKGTQTIMEQTSAHEMLTNAIGKSAATNRQAQIDSQVNAKYANASDTFRNGDAGKAAIAAEKIALGKSLAEADRENDAKAAEGIQQRIEAQLRLNAVILKGKDAVEQVTLANQAAAIKQDFATRGDSNSGAEASALAKNKAEFEANKAAGDLDKAKAYRDPKAAYNEQVKALNDIAEAAMAAGVQLDHMKLSEAAKENLLAYNASLDQTRLAVGSLSDGVSVFFDQMSRDTKSAAQQVHEVLQGAFNDLNNTLERLVTGQKASFSEMFRGIAGQLAKVGIQKAESGIVQAITGKSKTDPNAEVQKSNQWLERIWNTLNGNGSPSSKGIGGVVDSAAGALGSTGSGAMSFMSKAMGAISPFLSAIPGGSIIGSLFGGHRALGGPVSAGVSYDVGEMGRETFTPNSNGTITPNNKLGGSTVLHIDARGSNDPAQTEAAIHRAFAQYAPNMAQLAQRSQADNARRKPSAAH